MILEYLFLETQSRKTIEEYIATHLPQKIDITYLDSGAQNFWAVRFELKGDNKDNAKTLTETNDSFVKRFHPITLINESSEYFNRLLYPLVNKFERLLRKYLYVKAAICNDKTVRKKITGLEAKDFGTISHLLFVDDDFCKEARAKINGATSRADMLAILDEIKETTTWDTMVEKDTLAIVRENFEQLQCFRNDVMHAHNINFDSFKKAKAMFNEVNEQLQSEIDKTIKFETPSTLPDEFATILADRITATQNAIPILSTALDRLAELIKLELISSSEATSSLSKTIQQLYMNTTLDNLPHEEGDKENE